jgi:hypothetical protein
MRMRQIQAAALAAMLMAGWSGAGHAGPLSDAIFAPGAFAATETGTVTRYRHDRTGPEMPGAALAFGGYLVVAATAGSDGATPTLTLTHDTGAQILPIAAFPAEGGNPVLLFFLENVARNVAQLTGGSPFYIRNRLREALVDADMGASDTRTVADDTVAVTEAVIHPFRNDPNRARMGEFADLTLRLTVAPSRPEQLVSLSADTGEGGGAASETGSRAYTETLSLITGEP